MLNVEATNRRYSFADMEAWLNSQGIPFRVGIGPASNGDYEALFYCFETIEDSMAFRLRF